jgi:hypothetical protein
MRRALSIRRRLSVRVGIAVYALFLVTAAFEHHDLLCHLKTPQHCTSCASSLLGSDPHALAFVSTCHLTDAGRAEVSRASGESLLFAAASNGRSPPAIG